jgi:hypothetical protein
MRQRIDFTQISDEAMRGLDKRPYMDTARFAKLILM